MTLPTPLAGHQTVIAFVQAVISGGHVPTPSEITELRKYVASRPFNTTPQRIDQTLATVLLDVTSLPSKIPSLELHLYKRVFHDKQWSQSNQLTDYESDIQAAFLDGAGLLVFYSQLQGYVICALAPNNIPRSRLGVQARSRIYAVYSVKKDEIITGYQTNYHPVDNNSSSDPLDNLAIGGDAVWL